MPLPRELVEKWATIILRDCYLKGSTKYGSAAVAVMAIAEGLEYAEDIIADYKHGAEREFEISQIALELQSKFIRGEIGEEHVS